MGLEEIPTRGERGRVLLFVRENGRSPARAFLEECQGSRRKQFQHQFELVAHLGDEWENRERFKRLSGLAEGLWEFKQFDHRLYSARRVVGKKTTVVLLSGWIKDKAGRSLQENQEIEKALRLLEECRSLHGGFI